MTVRPLAFALLAACSAQAQANIDIQFDFTYDTAGFFSSNVGSTAALDAAAAVFETRLADNLTAITSSGGNNFSTLFFNPSDPFGDDVTLGAQSVAADVIRVYVGGANLGDGVLGLGGPGGYGCSGSFSFCSNAPSRGQGGADFAPWGGSISFDNASTDWHFGTTTSGLDFNEFDFYSVAVHELGHVLGFGTADSFDARIVGNNFVGPNAGTVPLLAGDLAHWAEGTQGLVNGVLQEAAMSPSIANGQRKYFTDLDFAALQDIGWEVTPVPEADTWAMLLAGLGLVGFAARRRMA